MQLKGVSNFDYFLVSLSTITQFLFLLGMNIVSLLQYQSFGDYLSRYYSRNLNRRLINRFISNAKVMFEDAIQVANDPVGTIRTVASYCAEEKVMEIYRKKCVCPTKIGIRTGVISGIGFGLSLALVFFAYATAFYAGARLVAAGHTTFEDVFRVSKCLN